MKILSLEPPKRGETYEEAFFERTVCLDLEKEKQFTFTKNKAYEKIEEVVGRNYSERCCKRHFSPVFYLVTPLRSEKKGSPFWI